MAAAEAARGITINGGHNQETHQAHDTAAMIACVFVFASPSARSNASICSLTTFRPSTLLCLAGDVAPAAPTPSEVSHTPTKPTSVVFRGDVPPAVQRQLVAFSDFHLKDVNFARTTGRDLVLTEAAVYKRPEDRKLQSRVVYQIIVGEGTLRIAYTRPDAVCSHALRYAQQAAHDSRRLHRLPRRRVRSMSRSPRLDPTTHSPCSRSDARLSA